MGMRVAVVILAAGGSVRFGGRKQLAKIGDNTLIELVLEQALAVEDHFQGVAFVDVVLGAYQDEIRNALEASMGCLPEVNIHTFDRWEEGMGSSLAFALKTVSSVRGGGLAGALIMLVDQPAIPMTHYLNLIYKGCQAQCNVLSSWGRGVGVPVFIHHTAFKEIESLKGVRGAKSILMSLPYKPLVCKEALLDVDTMDDLKKIRRRLGAADRS